MEVLKKYKNQLWFHVLLNVVFLLFITYSTFFHVPLSGIEDRLNYLFLLLLVQFCIFGFLYFLSLNKYIFAVLFPIVFLLCGISAFWVYSQDIIINEGVVKATLETKPDVVSDLVSLPLILFLLVLIGTTFYLVKRLFKTKNNSLKSPLTFLALASLGVFAFVVKKRPSTFSSRLPFNIYYSTKEYFRTPEITFKKIVFPVKSNADSLQVILVLGESVRADHIVMNGYKRNTMPNISKRNDVVSFKNIYTNKTYTAISVPQILSDQTLNDEKNTSFYSLTDLLNAAQVKTAWIGNQTPEKSYQPFISSSTVRQLIDPYHSEFSFHKQFDIELLRNFENQFNGKSNEFLIYHMMGSHWFYENRYPENFRKFTPVIHSKYVKANSPEEMINSYDNTILYLDDFLDSLIKKVESKNSNTVIIYLSDHGEALGENGDWLHAQDSNGIKNPAMMIWFSKKYREQNPTQLGYLNSIKNQKITTDFLFHSVLSLFKIEGFKVNKSDVIFKNQMVLPKDN